MLKLEVGKTYVDETGKLVPIHHHREASPGVTEAWIGRWECSDLIFYADGTAPGVGVRLNLKSGEPTGRWLHRIVAEVPAPQPDLKRAQEEITALHDGAVQAHDARKADPEKTHPPLPQQAATPFDPFKGFDYTVTRGGEVSQPASNHPLTRFNDGRAIVWGVRP